MKVKGPFALYRRHQLLDMKKRCVFVGKKNIWGSLRLMENIVALVKKKKIRIHKAMLLKLWPKQV